MVYSSGASSVFQAAKSILSPFLSSSTSTVSSHLTNKKIETSDPRELDEAYLRAELGPLGTGSSASQEAIGAGTLKEAGEDKKPFARPRGPARRR
jgi:twinfilin-like protein